MIFSAVADPTPGRSSSSFSVAVFRSTFAVDLLFECVSAATAAGAPKASADAARRTAGTQRLSRSRIGTTSRAPCSHGEQGAPQRRGRVQTLTPRPASKGQRGGDMSRRRAAVLGVMALVAAGIVKSPTVGAQDEKVKRLDRRME